MSVPQDGDWARVHPVSPLVRGWIALAAIAFVIGRNWFEEAAGFRGDNSAGTGAPLDGTALLIGAGILAAVLLILACIFFLSWWFTRYQVTGEHVRVHSGVVFRKQRQARLDRVQAIDIVQPLLARLFGLAELRFEVADAGESAVQLAYLKLDDAHRLRALLLDRASGTGTGTGMDTGAGIAGAGSGGTESVGMPESGAAGNGPSGPGGAPAEAQEQPVLELRPGRVIASTLLSGTTLFLLIGIIAVLIVTAATGEAISLAILLPIVFGTVGGYWTEFSTSFNFRASVSRDGIRLRYGLLDTRTQTVPPGRIQGVSVTQSPLWRLTGWYRVSVNVAGYGAGTNSDTQARTKLLPAGTLAEVFAVDRKSTRLNSSHWE